jgi:hypothetical protein
MPDFKDRLWRDLVREHGADLARIQRSAHRRPPRRVVAAAAAGLAAAGAALLVALGTSGTPPAYAVDRHADGTVTVTINRVEGIRGANARLEALGIRVRAVPFVAGCAGIQTATGAPAAMLRALKFARARAGTIMSVRIAPWRLQRGKVAVVAAGPVKPPAVVAEAKHGAVPQCVGPGHAAPAPVVVCHTADGRFVPFPRKPLPPAGDSGGNVGGPGAARARAIFCEARDTHRGPSGNSGNSGDSGVSGNS